MAVETRRRLLTLALALVGLAIFPFGWLSSVWPAFAVGFEAAFASEWGHRLGHAGVFAVVGAALLWTAPPLRRRPLIYAAMILSVGLAQEGAQLAYKARPPGGAELFDLATDLAAGLAIRAAAAALTAVRSRWRCGAP